MARVAVVTGANKGIGFEIVKRLCKELDGNVYLTARDADKGRTAVAKLEAEGLHPKFHQLDITSHESVETFKEYLKETYGGLDILVNNAGTAYTTDSTAPFSEQASVTVANNFTGTLRITKALFPLIRPHGRVVNVSSTLGRLDILQEHLQKKFADPNLTEEVLVTLMEQFVKDVHDGQHTETDWPNTANGTSKVGMTALAKVYAREAARLGDVLVNACCPGWCQTDKSSHSGPNIAAKGADTPVHLALLPPGSPSGEFWRDNTMGRVAVVTGADKGIGFEIVKRLCKEFDGNVYLTARYADKGRKAVAELEAEGLHPKFYQLDITSRKSVEESQESVEKFKKYLDRAYGGLDILVNNESTAYNDHFINASEQASETIAINFIGTQCITKALFPLIRPHGRVVNVSSTRGQLGILGKDLQKKFTDPNLTEGGLVALMKQFVEDVHNGQHTKSGWPNTTAYGTSKVGVTALAKVYAREAATLGKDDVLVNACCPGCQMDMPSYSGPNTAAQGAETPVHLALLPQGSPSGEFWRYRLVVEW